MTREVSEYDRRHGFEALHHEERQFEEAAASHRREAEILLQAVTARVATQANVAAQFDERQRIYLHELSVESAHALEAQRDVLSHEAAEEFHGRDSISVGVMRTLEFESHSDVEGQRERI